MLLNKQILLVGGATRNVGKTTFICRIIEKFSREVPIVALKIKTLRKDDAYFHGKDRNPLKENEFFRITEETVSGNEDTQKMFSPVRIASLK